MKTYRVRAQIILNCETNVEASDEDEAEIIASGLNTTDWINGDVLNEEVEDLYCMGLYDDVMKRDE